MSSKNALLALAAITLVFLPGCVDSNEYLRIAMSEPRAGKFMSEHPESNVVSIEISKDAVRLMLDEIKQECGPAMEEKAYWYVELSDAGSKLAVYIDLQTKEIECVYDSKAGQTPGPGPSPGPEPGPECAIGSDCETGEWCCNGACKTPACTENNDCRTGQVCLNKGTCDARCSAGCESNDDCRESEQCCSGKCGRPACVTNFDCDDENPETADSCAGGGGCEAECRNREVGDCLDNDGACPSNCDPGNDTDCFAPGGQTLRVGQSLTGLRGQGSYWGERELFIKLQWVNKIAPLRYQARLELYRQGSRLVDGENVMEDNILNETFMYGGKAALLDYVEVAKIYIGENSGKGYVELNTTGECEDDDEKCFSNCDEGNDNGCWQPGKSVLREEEKVENLRGLKNYIGLTSLSVELVSVSEGLGGLTNIGLFKAAKGTTEIDSKEVRGPTNLSGSFEDSFGEPILRDTLNVNGIFLGEKTGLGYAEIELALADDGILVEGETLTGLSGSGIYSGQNDLYAKLKSVEPEGSYHRAEFELFSGQGTMIGSQLLSYGDSLRQEFLDDGQDVLVEPVLVSELGIGEVSGKGYAKIG